MARKYQLFKKFVSIIDDCSEQGLTADEIRNRLDWGWHALAQFAQAMGPRYHDRVYCFCVECSAERNARHAPYIAFHNIDGSEGQVH
jgi:hypothetical protein